MRVLAGLTLSAAMVLAGYAQAYAETTVKDVETAVRTLRYLISTPPSPSVVAVVYDPDVASSQAEADAVMAMLKDGMVGGTAVSGRLVAVGRLTALSGAAMAFVTSGTETHRMRIFQAASANGVLSVATDESCARSGQCVMSVKAEPRVTILVNAAAAKASRVEFGAAFRMMITEF